MPLLIKPDPTVYLASDSGYYENYIREVKEVYPDYTPLGSAESTKKKTYSGYNYQGKGVSNKIKTGHFEAALKIARPYFGKAKVLDMGCADGYFTPSLSHYFPEVVIADINEKHIRVAESLIAKMNLMNVRSYCTAGEGFDKLRGLYPGYFDLVFLLETMEHVGDRGDLYPSKLKFLLEVSEMLKPGGRIVISVPVMTGLRFLLQRAGLWALGMDREPMTLREILRSGILGKTGELEKRWWPHGHVGFNHHKMLQSISGHFTIVKQKKLLFQELIAAQKK